MDLELTPEQDRFVRDAIDSGRVDSREGALREALGFWMIQGKLEAMVAAAQARLREGGGEPCRELGELLASIAGALERGSADDPFATFDEWSGDADRRAYADL